MGWLHGRVGTEVVRSRRIIERRAAHQIVVIPLFFPGALGCRCLGCSLSLSVRKIGELKAGAGHTFLKRRSDGRETKTLVDREHSF